MPHNKKDTFITNVENWLKSQNAPNLAGNTVTANQIAKIYAEKNSLMSYGKDSEVKLFSERCKKSLDYYKRKKPQNEKAIQTFLQTDNTKWEDLIKSSIPEKETKKEKEKEIYELIMKIVQFMAKLKCTSSTTGNIAPSQNHPSNTPGTTNTAKVNSTTNKSLNNSPSGNPPKTSSLFPVQNLRPRHTK